MSFLDQIPGFTVFIDASNYGSSAHLALPALPRTSGRHDDGERHELVDGAQPRFGAPHDAALLNGEPLLP